MKCATALTAIVTLVKMQGYATFLRCLWSSWGFSKWRALHQERGGRATHLGQVTSIRTCSGMKDRHVWYQPIPNSISIHRTESNASRLLQNGNICMLQPGISMDGGLSPHTPTFSNFIEETTNSYHVLSSNQSSPPKHIPLLVLEQTLQ